MPVRFEQDMVQLASSLKILWIILDQGLRYKEHLASSAGKAYKAALAMKRLQGLRPSSMRQLFLATVTPATDYASPVWYLTVPDQALAVFDRAQRVAAQAIIGGFKTMGLGVAILKASIQTIQEMLHQHTLNSGSGYKN
jgi:hypothetical protein